MQDQIKQDGLIDSLNFPKHLLVNNTFENTLVNTIGTMGDSIVESHSNTQEKMTKTTKNLEGAYTNDFNLDKSRHGMRAEKIRIDK
jgi:hypothetical protein